MSPHSGGLCVDVTQRSGDVQGGWKHRLRTRTDVSSDTTETDIQKYAITHLISDPGPPYALCPAHALPSTWGRRTAHRFDVCVVWQHVEVKCNLSIACTVSSTVRPYTRRLDTAVSRCRFGPNVDVGGGGESESAEVSERRSLRQPEPLWRS